MSDTFKDFIPDGEDTGAITKDGFQDFVPTPEPKPQTITEVVIEQPQPEPTPEPIQEVQPEIVIDESVSTVSPLEPIQEVESGS